MKKLLVAGIAAAAFLSAPALAQTASPFNWSGFYVGVNGGAMDFKTKDGDFINAPGFFWNTDKKQVAVGGIHGGFQGQWGNFVLGIEGAWDAVLGSGFSSRDGGGAGAPCGFTVLAGGDFCQARINDILSVGPRVGLAWGQLMIYGTGGYARAEIESQGSAPGVASVFSPASNHHDGWYLGGGLEWLVVSGFVVGVEYKHFDFTSADHIISPNVASINDRSMKAEADAVLLRLTIKQ